jgi:hypothetical protein
MTGKLLGALGIGAALAMAELAAPASAQMAKTV